MDCDISNCTARCYTYIMSDHQKHALYQVATKAFIHDNKKVLVLYTPSGTIDFPGGRVDETERNIGWTESLQREVAEELGEDIRISIGKTLFVGKRSYTHNGITHHIATIFYSCAYITGKIALSDEHDEHEWTQLKKLQASNRPFLSDDERLHIQNIQSL